MNNNVKLGKKETVDSRILNNRAGYGSGENAEVLWSGKKDGDSYSFIRHKSGAGYLLVKETGENGAEIIYTRDKIENLAHGIYLADSYEKLLKGNRPGVNRAAESTGIRTNESFDRYLREVTEKNIRGEDGGILERTKFQAVYDENGRPVTGHNGLAGIIENDNNKRSGNILVPQNMVLEGGFYGGKKDKPVLFDENGSLKMMTPTENLEGGRWGKAKEGARENYIPFQEEANRDRERNFNRFAERYLTNVLNGSLTGTEVSKLGGSTKKYFKDILLEKMLEDPAYMVKLANRATMNVLNENYFPNINREKLAESFVKDSKLYKNLHEMITRHVKELAGGNGESHNPEFTKMSKGLVEGIRKEKGITDEKIYGKTDEFCKENLKDEKNAKVLTDTYLGQIAKTVRKIKENAMNIVRKPFIDHEVKMATDEKYARGFSKIKKWGKGLAVGVMTAAVACGVVQATDLGDVVESLQGVLKSGAEAIGEFGSSLKEGAEKIFDGVVKGGTEIAGDLGSTIKEGAEKLVDGVRERMEISEVLNTGLEQSEQAGMSVTEVEKAREIFEVQERVMEAKIELGSETMGMEVAADIASPGNYLDGNIQSWDYNPGRGFGTLEVRMEGGEIVNLYGKDAREAAQEILYMQDRGEFINPNRVTSAIHFEQTGSGHTFGQQSDTLHRLYEKGAIDEATYARDWSAVAERQRENINLAGGNIKSVAEVPSNHMPSREALRAVGNASRRGRG